jgi:drug/metabolite transporter (DMT)-like permease
MTELIFSILSSTVLFFIFRLFPKYGVDTAQAIIVNYFTAFICGCLVSGGFPSIATFGESGLLPWTILAGFLFISLFVVMGISSYRNGMGKTSVAVKMNMALSMIFFIVAYDEPVTWIKLLGFVLAFAGILLMTLERAEDAGDTGYVMLLFLFIGSAALDILLNYVKKMLLGDYPDSLFTAFGFLAAGLLGTVWMTIEYVRKKRHFSWRNVVGGILLGIPNYFSIYLLIRSYGTTGWKDTTTLAVTGIAVVSLAALFGMFIFKESARWPKLLGLVSAIAAIILLGIFSA